MYSENLKLIPDIRTMDDRDSPDWQMPSSKGLIGKDLIFFRSEYLLEKLNIPDDIQLEFPVQVPPDFYNQFARTTKAREYDEESFVMPDAPTIKLTSMKQPKKEPSKRKTKTGTYQANDGAISIEIQKLFLKEKISF